HFRKALQIDPTYIEAQLNIARTHTLLGEPDAEKNYRKVMVMDSTYAPVYLELAQWYLDRGYEVYYEELRPLYEKYIALRPDDAEGHYGLGLMYTDQKNYGAVLDVSLVVIRLKKGSNQWLALMAQAYAARGEPDKAMVLFEKYLERIAPDERAVYEDLRLVAFPEELEIYQNTPVNGREAFLEDFWRKRDSLLVSEGQARRAEHYRRVWYARTHFAKKVYPWDKRGEVYIRYGEPDYRSRSGFPNLLPSLAVENVKTKIHADVGDLATPASRGKVVEPEAFFSRGSGIKPSTNGLDVPLIEPVYPVLWDPIMSPKQVPWEAWIYTDVGGGID
ncbi:MAG: GWxTD domain-containing protein, partial [Candidatus Latescibacteria bacterium]|nr:GWxTD domain-containing protein [Candidatus Latescibacterota bacterium]